jgi:hypothetical protein
MPPEIQPKGGFLLPPPPDACQVCAKDHPEDQPHNQQSLYYQMDFLNKNGRYPTWQDAMSHCAPEVQRLWRAELEKLGAWSEPVEGMSPEMKTAAILGGLPTHSGKQIVKPGEAFKVTTHKIRHPKKKAKKR